MPWIYSFARVRQAPGLAVAAFLSAGVEGDPRLGQAASMYVYVQDDGSQKSKKRGQNGSGVFQ
uniref:Uncharacterized protein n=1 Tax=viral metagenome TaxID=1070528 RepID=A0A6M3JQ71_9ZZZZ